MSFKSGEDAVSRKTVLSVVKSPRSQKEMINMIEGLPSVQPAQITPNQKTESMKRLTNAEWKDFLSEQFDISRTSAKEMLHAMMSVKKEDNFKKQFSGRKRMIESEVNV